MDIVLYSEKRFKENSKLKLLTTLILEFVPFAFTVFHGFPHNTYRIKKLRKINLLNK